MDLYSHTHKFFKPNKHTDDYAKQVEVGERRIRTAATDMDELDQKVYGGKRVSREDMAAKVLAVASDDSDSDSNEEVESYDDEEDMEDEDDEEEMEGESIESDEEIES